MGEEPTLRIILWGVRASCRDVFVTRASALGFLVHAAEREATCDQAWLTADSALVTDAGENPMKAVATCARLSALFPRLTQIVLTAEGDERLKPALFEAGASLVVQPPFTIDPILAFCHAKALSTGQRSTPPATLQKLSGRLVLDVEGKCLRDGKDAIPLTPGKFELLSYLALRPGRAVTADELIKAGILSKTQRSRYRSIVRELREKLGADRSLIRTVPGYGYKFEQTPPQQS